MSLLPFVPRARPEQPSPGPPRYGAQPPPPRNGAEQPPQPGFLQRTFGGQPQQPPSGVGRPARGILVPGQQMPHVILNTVQVCCIITSVLS